MAWLNRANLSLQVERWSPFIAAITTLITCVVFEDQIIKSFLSFGLSLPQLYTAIFGWASVMTGFQFGVYGLILSKTDGFINVTRRTKAMKLFLDYTAKAVRLGFILTVFGMPFLVFNADMKDINNLTYWLGSFYVSLFVYSFAATVRVAYIFSIMVQVPNVERLPA